MTAAIHVVRWEWTIALGVIGFSWPVRTAECPEMPGRMFARYLGSIPSGKQENGMVLYGRVDQSGEVTRVMTNLAFLHFHRRLLNS